MKYLFIINPNAGNDDQKKLISRMQSTFRMIDDEMKIVETEKAGDAREFAEKASKMYGSDCVVVCCGGDGTVHEVVNGLCGTDTALMILPLGTGNDFAKKVYGTKTINVMNVIKAFGFMSGKINYDIKPIDVIDYNGEKGINVMSFGLDTIVETVGRQIASKLPFLGHKAYSIAVAPVLMKPIHYNISFELNCVNKETGEEYTYLERDKDYALFALCNASYYGGGFCPAPNSVLDDGFLDYVVVDGMPLSKAIPIVPKYSAGTVNQDNCELFHNGYVKSGKIWTEDGSSLLGNCDGENFNYQELDFKVLPKALKLCVLKDY